MEPGQRIKDFVTKPVSSKVSLVPLRELIVPQWTSLLIFWQPGLVAKNLNTRPDPAKIVDPVTRFHLCKQRQPHTTPLQCNVKSTVDILTNAAERPNWTELSSAANINAISSIRRSVALRRVFHKELYAPFDTAFKIS